MQIIVIAAQKGGAGKTTLALHLAVEYQRAGKSVALIDTDPQRSAEMWGGLRDAQDITVVGVPGAEIAAALRDAESDGYDVVLVDTPPHASAALVPVLRLATLAVVPFQPSPLDLGTLETVRRMLDAAGTPAVAVINAAPLRAAEVEPMRQAIEEGGLPVLETVVHHLMPFRRSIGNGLSVVEFDPKGRGAFEIKKLRKDIDAAIAALPTATPVAA
ncbi:MULTISPECIES: ParA family protein [Xanthomonas]|uniref:ParA family protein n=1 Tax=Xanthomonas manihotis TaxID=43353 RepID=A0A8I1XMT1_XANMN|nr:MULTISPECIES: ParA family protein [Xanthomonas]NEK70260.1 ParA family protein [Xanthomonas perforans]RWU13219.1 ParA family protein [Xanthomonas phaseoli pv. manihotis str. CIO151]KUF33894.1 hypothetical protein AO826_21245 [Xanthomonas phaseoli pv. manihotis]MBO9722452.1 ParA family protein [Xanthomonas phaseoli pv. manihotis]MBO9757257.1 ParA family protein [Xanthomonas phaseoli pv. manihotis]